MDMHTLTHAFGVTTYAAAGLEAAYVASNLLLSYLADCKSKKQRDNLSSEKTAILLGGDKSDKLKLHLFDLGPIKYYFAGKGEVKVFNRASKQDLEGVMADSSYDNVVIAGHGATTYWEDSNKEPVHYSSLPRSSKKRIIQMTCGTRNNGSLVERCATNREESFYPTKLRNSISNYLLGMKLLLGKPIN